jgi:hypothetical protein
MSKERRKYRRRELRKKNSDSKQGSWLQPILASGAALCFFGGVAYVLYNARAEQGRVAYVFYNARAEQTAKPNLRVAAKPELRVEKYIRHYGELEKLIIRNAGRGSVEDIEDQEAIKITNVGQSSIMIDRVVFNNRDGCAIYLYGGLLKGKSISVVYDCSGSIVEAKIETDHGTSKHTFKTDMVSE